MTEFYGTVDAFKAYHLARDNDVPATVTDDEIEARLLKASEWLDSRYRDAFAGVKLTGRVQEREWPRSGAVDRYGYAIPSIGYPREVERATYEATLREIATPGVLSADLTPGKYKKVSVEGAVSVEFAQFNSVGEVQTQFAIIGEIMSPILAAVGSGIVSPYSGSVVRA